MQPMKICALIRRICSTRPVMFGAIMAVVLFAGAFLSMQTLYEVSIEAARDGVRTNLRRLAEVAATVVNGDKHSSFTSQKQESTAEYEAIIAPLRKVQESDPDIAFVYTCVFKDGKAYFVLDPTEEGDSDGDGMDDKSHIMQEYPEASEHMLKVMRTRKSSTDPEPYTDRWGTFMSGYAPIKDSKGNVVATLGLDITADRYLARLEQMKKAHQAGIFVALLISVLVGAIAGLMRHSSLRQRQEADRKELEHREAISDALERLEFAYQAVELSRKRFSQLFEGLPVPCVTFDQNLQVFEWNVQAEEIFDFRAKDALQRNLGDVLGGRFENLSLAELGAAVLAGQSVQDQAWTDGERHFVFSCHPLHGPDGRVAGGILAAVDVTRQTLAEEQVRLQFNELRYAHELLNKANSDLVQANSKLEELATTDPLTGLANKRALAERLEEFGSLARRGEQFSVVMADIDHFKSLNDRFGHFAGDQVLRSVAAALKAPLRGADFIARYGGEEFCILLRGADEAAAAVVAERMREAVETIRLEYGKVTASFGVCEFSNAFDSLQTAVLAADHSLYEAKRKGRNQVCRASNAGKAA